MKMLCKKCNSQADYEKWLPTSVDSYGAIVSRKISSSDSDYKKALNKNICYNLQYLEYISECIKQLYLTSSLYTQCVKTFLIVSASIIEGILYHELKSNGLNNKSIWNYIKDIISETKIFDRDIRLETKTFEKLPIEKDLDMTFDQMINKVEAKQLLGENHNVYAKINIIRKLRNKVHIHIGKSSFDSDYNSFNFEKLNLAKETLYEILAFYFQLTEDEKDVIFKYLIIEEKIAS
jgi:hypothetical protein